jgi:acyl-coenzyme A thioesterase PaaI-like protein
VLAVVNFVAAQARQARLLASGSPDRPGRRLELHVCFMLVLSPRPLFTLRQVRLTVSLAHGVAEPRFQCAAHPMHVGVSQMVLATNAPGAGVRR